MSRTVFRRIRWTIGPDRTEGAPQTPIRQHQCTTCGEQSAPSDSQADPDTWAISHTGATGHTGFREIVTGFLRVVPAAGSPLRGEG